MRIHILQHEDFVGPGLIAPWALKHEHELRFCRPDRGEPFPALGRGELLIILGGTMNVDEERQHPWLAAEKRYLERAIAAGGHILGICLGGQMIARVMGGRVTRNAHKEIGWHKVRRRPEAAHDPLFSQYPLEFPAFQWHQDTFSIPADCRHLAESDACATQAFSYEGRVLGVQFHLEADARVVRTLVESCPEELDNKGPYIQGAERILGAREEATTANQMSERLLDRMVSAARGGDAE